MRDLNIYIANCYFYEGRKVPLDISPYIGNSEIKITYANNNIIPTLENLTCEFFNNEELMSEVAGLHDFIKSHKDLSLFNIIVQHGNSIIFNGIIELYSLSLSGNYRLQTDKPMQYDLSSIIHKSSELKYKYISKILSYKNINITNYFNYLFETNNKITKYLETIINENTVNITQNYFTMDKTKLYNSNVIMVGDTLHLTTTDGNKNITNQSHIIKNVYEYYEDSQYNVIDTIEFYDRAQFYDDVYIIVQQDKNVYIKVGNETVGIGTLDTTTLICKFTGIHSGKIKFKSDTYYLIKNYLGYYWGTQMISNWGQYYANVYWGLGYVAKINMTNLKIETFTDLNLIKNSTIKAWIGYKAEALDDVSETVITNPIIKFNSAMSLIDDMSSDYLFNYSTTNDGKILLYTNTLDTTENEDYILQVGNNPYNLLYDSSIALTNSNVGVITDDFDLSSYNIYWGFPVNNILWGQVVDGLYWGYGSFMFNTGIDGDVIDLENQLIITPASNLSQYSCRFTLNNLISGHRYLLDINTTADDIQVKCNGSDLDLNELEYYDTPKFSFIMPTGQTSIDIILIGNIGTDSITIEKISVMDYYWTDFEYDAVFSTMGINIDATGIRTALNVTNFTQTQESEFIEQIAKVSPAINTFHKIDEIPYEPNKTYSTGAIDTNYIQLGRSLSSITFPILLDEESAFINTISINTFRNTLESNMCILASLIENSDTYVFNQIIPYSQIDSSTLTLTPAFVNKKSGNKLECILKSMIYETGKVVSSNSFTSTYSSYYIVGEKVGIPTGNAINYYTILSVVGNIITLTEAIINGTYSILVNKNNTATGEYLELQVNTNFTDTGDYIILDDIQNSSLQLVKDIAIQTAYVTRYPIENIGSTYNGIPNQMFLLDENVITDTFKVVDINKSNVVGKSFIANNNDFFNPLLDYDLVYLDLFNATTNKWEVFKIKSYNSTNGTITLYDSISLDSYVTNELCQFRRIYITTSASFESKATDDDIYEAYITNDRYAFGFNYKIDRDAVDYLLNGNLTATNGKLYDIGNIFTCMYNVGLTYPRYLEEYDSVNKYGIIEEVYSEAITDDTSYVLVSQNQLKYNKDTVNKVDITVHLGYLADVMPNIDLTKIQLIRLYHERLPDNGGLYSIESKVFSFKKSGIHTCKLSLEKIVGD